MSDPLSVPIRGTTQDHLEIEDVIDNIVLLKDGSCSLVLSTTAINFGLLSEREQDATIFAYAALLNSLTFPIQLVIRSRQKDVSAYLGLLDKEITKQTNSLLKDQMNKYRRFVEETVKKNNVLDKTFYIVIPFSLLELGASKALLSVVKKPKSLPYPKEFIIERAKMNLLPKRDHVVRQFGRLGLKIREIKTEEVIQLFYDYYNAENAGTQRLAVSQDYAAPMVNPLIPKKGETK